MDRLSKGVREAPTKAVMNELAKESGDSPDAAYGKIDIKKVNAFKKLNKD